MCGGGGGGGSTNSEMLAQQKKDAAEARAREEQRAASIRTGVDAVNALFDRGQIATTGTTANPAFADWQTRRNAFINERLASYAPAAQAPTPDPSNQPYFLGGENDFVNPAYTTARPVAPGGVPAEMRALLDREADDKFGAAPVSELAGVTGYRPTDNGFTGFNDAFYNRQRDAYVNYALPQLDDQHGKQRDQLTFALARAGTLNSSMANQKTADLQTEYDIGKAQILNEGQRQANALRGQVEDQRANLISLVNATGDAAGAANQALSRSQQLYQTQPAMSPLGQMFSNVASGVGQFIQGQQNQQLLNALKPARTTTDRSRVVSG